jgi:AcrR family transcriptional regulator
MSTPRTLPERERRSDGAGVARRAPFSDNPRVGVRGQRTQQRILDAALTVFADEGYHRASIDRITKVAGCSRVSFYQYFASKEDVFRSLAGQVARQVTAATESLETLTADREGWSALREWVARYADTYERYESVFHAYETDDELARIAARTGAEVITGIQSRIEGTSLSPRQLNPVLRLLVETLGHTLGIAGVFRSVAPDAYPNERVEEALTDIQHRTLFGRRDDVNVHPTSGSAPPTLPFGPAMRELLQGDEDGFSTNAEGSRALSALLASGRDVFVSRGFHNTRVDDLVEAAGVSHGAFYRYFPNKEDLARVLTARGFRAVGATLRELPDVLSTRGSVGRAKLRRWLRQFNGAQASEAGMSRVWLDAALQDPALRGEVAPPWDWGRRQVSQCLQPRGFGDDDLDSLVMVGLLGVFGARRRPAPEIEAAAHIIERGFLGQ